MAAPDELSLSPAPSRGALEPGGSLIDPGDGPSGGRSKWRPVLFIAVFAAILASFPARNSDFWLHLAAGQRLAQEGYSSGIVLLPGVRPNESWLFDIVAYGVYSALGGAVLALCKVFLVVGLALVMLRLSRPAPPAPDQEGDNGDWRLAAVCTALALLAMSLRLLLQPVIVSYLFLALTLWILFRRQRSEIRDQRSEIRDQKPGTMTSDLWLLTSGARLLPPWPLLILFAAWVNVDSWFILGLGTVALFWLGRALDSAEVRGQKSEVGGQRSQFLTSSCHLAVLAAVCLLNPSHVHAFASPLELGWFGPPRSSAAWVAPGQITSPWQPAYFASLWRSPAGMAYFPLLGLSLLSFVLNRSRWSWERFLPWLALALLSAFHVRAIPFFAIVAGPVLAWNLREMAIGPPATESAIRRWRVRLTALFSYCLLICAWPGWLQGPPFEPRRWGVEFPPSLERGAETTRRWRQEGKLAPDKRGLHLSRESASAFAFFCPEENGLLDDHISEAILGGREADPSLPPVGQAFQPDGQAGKPNLRGERAVKGNVDERMRSAGIDHVIVYNSDHGRLLAVLDRLVRDPKRWPLLYLEGDLAVFGWRDSANQGQPDPFRGRELDLNRLAFHPSRDKKAPRTRPDQESETREWWEALWKPTPPRTLERDEATLHLLHAKALRRSAPIRRLATWEASQSAALVGAAGCWTGPLGEIDAELRLVLLRPPLPPLSPPLKGGAGGVAGGPLPPLSGLVLAFQQSYAQEQDDAPPALLYLAVRAARRAVAINPEDADAYLVLGESYLWLLHGTRERVWGRRAPELVNLRRAQASAALNRAVSLNPDLAHAHICLFGLYQEIEYLDLALEHLREFQRLSRSTGPPAGGSGPDAEQEPPYEELLSRLAEVVAAGENAYAAQADKLRVLDRAVLAFQNGLAGKARDQLLESNVAAFGPQGMMLELKLLLGTGRANKVREWTLPEHKSTLGAASYHWLRAQALAASGDYALAQEECELLASDSRGPESSQPRHVMFTLIGKAVLDEQHVAASTPHLVFSALDRLKFENRIAGLAKNLREEANANVFRGLLALEEGNVDDADVAFQLALELWKDEAAAAKGAGLDFKTRPIAQECLRWLE